MDLSRGDLDHHRHAWNACLWCLIDSSIVHQENPNFFLTKINFRYRYGSLNFEKIYIYVKIAKHPWSKAFTPPKTGFWWLILDVCARLSPLMASVNLSLTVSTASTTFVTDLSKLMRFWAGISMLKGVLLVVYGAIQPQSMSYNRTMVATKLKTL